MLLKTYLLVDYYRRNIADLLKQEEGQDLVEYALLVALISIVAVAAMTSVGTQVTAAFNHVAGQINAAVP